MKAHVSASSTPLPLSDLAVMDTSVRHTLCHSLIPVVFGVLLLAMNNGVRRRTK